MTKRMCLLFYFVDHRTSAMDALFVPIPLASLKAMVLQLGPQLLGMWGLCIKDLHGSVAVGHSCALGCKVCKVLILIRCCSVFPGPSQETKVKVTKM